MRISGNAGMPDGRRGDGRMVGDGTAAAMAAKADDGCGCGCGWGGTRDDEEGVAAAAATGVDDQRWPSRTHTGVACGVSGGIVIGDGITRTAAAAAAAGPAAAGAAGAA